MKKALFLILCSGFLNTAFAKDSTWNLCVGDVTIFEEKVKLVVNVYEHRNGAEGRQTELTMIYGGHVLLGAFDNTEADQALVNLKNEYSFYQGLAAVDYSKNTLTLRGKISLNESESPLSAKFRCTNLAN